MPKMKHPTVANLHVDVADADVDAWKEQGWLLFGEKKPAVVGEHGPEAVIPVKAPRKK